MPKRKTEASPPPTDDVEQAILKDFGDGVLVSGDDLLSHEKIIIPVSPSIDFAHNGGFQEGTFAVLSGPPRCGKTTTALHFAGNAQSPEHGSRQVIYLNAEARLERRDLVGIGRLKTDRSRFLIVQSTPPRKNEAGEVVRPGKILTAKDYLEIAERFLINTVGKVIILDSVSAMMGESEWNDGLDSVAIGEAQRLFAKFMRRMSQVIATNRHIFIGIVHLYSNVGMTMGPKWLEKMSTSANYGLATKLRSTGFEAWAVGSEKVLVGQKVKWKCERSPLGPPGVVVDGYVRYGHGIDEVQELIGYATDMQFIRKEKKSSWYELDGKKLQGEEAVRDYLVENPTALASLKSRVYEGLGLS